MGTINVGRVVLGGLVAGLIVNITESILNLVVVAQGMEDALRAHNLPPVGGSAIGGFVLLTFALGIVTIWLYAAIRPRFGPGPRTAMIAGLAVWFLSYVHQSASMTLMEILPAKVMTVGTLWGCAEILIASVAGAAIYKE
jgi:hypothetical protein